MEDPLQGIPEGSSKEIHEAVLEDFQRRFYGEVLKIISRVISREIWGKFSRKL